MFFIKISFDVVFFIKIIVVSVFLLNLNFVHCAYCYHMLNALFDMLRRRYDHKINMSHCRFLNEIKRFKTKRDKKDVIRLKIFIP